jgi:hypothetical protein
MSEREETGALGRRLYASKVAERREKVLKLKQVHIKNLDLEGL